MRSSLLRIPAGQFTVYHIGLSSVLLDYFLKNPNRTQRNQI